MSPDDILYAMRTGRAQSAEAITAFVQGVADGAVSRPQAAAWLAWAYQRQLTSEETVHFTRAMTHSGRVLKWDEGPLLIDKHSTGGVGDKISLILAPVWVELGYRVPMISGRGLGHTGGTLDKLESIPGYRTDLTVSELRGVLSDVGAFISGQTADLAPADRVLYALRNECCCVNSIPLIVGSILSKKLAEGVQRLVLDVKTGSGAFMEEPDDARRLARALVDVANAAGVQTSATITAMDRPLGRAVGNAIEVLESVEVLRGGGPEDVRRLVVALAHDPRAEEVLASGAAYARLEQMVAAQGGDVNALTDPHALGMGGTTEEVWRAPHSGVVQKIECLAVGRAAFRLGAGRLRAEDPVDPGVGLWVDVEVGDEVVAGQPLVRVIHRDGKELEAARALLSEAVVIGEQPPSPLPLIVDEIA